MPAQRPAPTRARLPPETGPLLVATGPLLVGTGPLLVATGPFLVATGLRAGRLASLVTKPWISREERLVPTCRPAPTGERDPARVLSWSG